MPCPAWSSTPLNIQNTIPAINGKWERLKNSTEIKISELFNDNWDQEDYFVSVARRSRAERHMLPPLLGTAPYQLLSTRNGRHTGLPQLKPSKGIYRWGGSPYASSFLLSPMYQWCQWTVQYRFGNRNYALFPAILPLAVFALYSFFSQFLTPFLSQTPYLLP